MYLALLTAVFFYIILPVCGGIISRTRWKSFRSRIMAAQDLPRLALHSVFEPEAEFRFYGEVDAIGGQNELWLRNEELACVIDARAASVFILSGTSSEGGAGVHGACVDELGVGAGDGDRLERVRWAALPSIPPVARAYAIGRARLDGGRMVLGPGNGKPVMLIIHDGRDEDLEPRAIWTGRQKNEYWNPLTQVSLVAGLLAMSVIVSQVLSARTLPTIAAITVAAGFSPLLPLLPPGVIGFIFYRSFWRQARFCRSKRDLAAFLGGSKSKLRSWSCRAVTTTALSAMYLAMGLAVNFVIVVLVLRRIL